MLYLPLVLRDGEGNSTQLQYCCLENPMDGGAWWAAVHGVAKSWTRLSDFTFTFHFHALEEEMATHSSVLAWRIPKTGEPGGLPSLGSHRVGHDWSDLAAVAAVLREWIILGDGSVVSCGFPELPDPYYIQAWGSREKQLLQLWTGVEVCVFPPTPT